MAISSRRIRAPPEEDDVDDTSDRVMCEVCHHPIHFGEMSLDSLRSVFDARPCPKCVRRRNGIIAHEECCFAHCSFCGRAGFELFDSPNPDAGIDTCSNCKADMCIGDSERCVKRRLRQFTSEERARGGLRGRLGVMHVERSRASACEFCMQPLCTKCVHARCPLCQHEMHPARTPPDSSSVDASD